MDKEQYLEKLRDPRWQKTRLAVLERDEWACQICFDSKSTLHVHHRWYGNVEPWDYPIGSLVTLCEFCHENETEDLKTATSDLIQILKQSGAMSAAFSAIAGAFLSHRSGRSLSDGPPDQWDILAFVISETLTAFQTRDPAWRAAECRFYAMLGARRTQLESIESESNNGESP